MRSSYRRYELLKENRRLERDGPAVLAGCDRPDLFTRLRLRVFYLIVAWNERSSIVPPSDDGSAAPATPRGSQDQAV